MPNAIFVGFKDHDFGCRSEPLISFNHVEDAIKWKNEDGQKDRDFVLVEVK